ncbi:MAG: hypothetical protein GXO10_03045, partial [Crenarchaeota archaeon]|nr:hypothetical protein [Thermoproteota archaeon]
MGLLDKLKSLVGGKDASLDSNISKLQERLDTISIHTGTASLADLFREMGDATSLEQIVREIEPSSLTYTESDRIQRYILYDSIYRMIPYAKRALKVLTANILSPNDVTKVYFKIVKVDSDIENEKVDIVINNATQIFRLFGIIKNVRNIIRNTLKYGDYFVWIRDARAIVEKLDKSKVAGDGGGIMLEIAEYKPTGTTLMEQDNDNNQQPKSTAQLIDEFQRSQTQSQDQNTQSDQSLREIQQRVNELYIEYLSPERVIALTYESTCFGYLIVPDQLEILDTLLHPVSTRANANRIAQGIVKRIIDKLSLSKDLTNKLTGEFAQIVARLTSTAKFDTNIKVIYVRPEYMQHFKIDSDKYKPYGESIFSSVELDAKILIALKTALASWRISSSVEKRIVAVEVGLPKRASEVVQKLKQTLRQRKVTIDSFGTLDAIPSSISSFEVLYTPMKDGKRYIEFDTQSPSVDVGAKTEELKTFRDSIISGLGIPPAFVGVDEVEKKATLSYQNVLFTRDIIDYQAIFTDQFNELLHKLYKHVIKDTSDWAYLHDITVQFQIPKNLQIEVTSQLISTITSTISSLKELGISQDYLVQEFLGPLLDLEEAEKYKEDEQLESKSGNNQPGSAPTGGGGGFG